MNHSFSSLSLPQRCLYLPGERKPKPLLISHLQFPPHSLACLPTLGFILSVFFLCICIHIYIIYYFLTVRTALWGLLGGPMAKTLRSQCRGPGINSWSGSQIPHATAKSSHAATTNPMCHSEDWWSHILQLRPGAAKLKKWTKTALQRKYCHPHCTEEKRREAKQLAQGHTAEWVLNPLLAVCVTPGSSRKPLSWAPPWPLAGRRLCC